LDPDTKFDMLCELDAVVAHLYALSEAHLRHVFATFHDKWKPGTTASHPTLGPYDERLARTLEYFKAWKRRR